jgi:hypothetical protein
VRATANILYQDTTRVNWLWRYLRDDGEEYVSAGMNATGDSPMSWSHGLEAGTYYLQIGRYHGDTYINLYNLTLYALSPCENDTYEDNDFFDEAVALGEGTYNLKACQNDKDFFSINANAGHTITVRVDGGGSNTRRLYVHNPDKTLLEGFQNSSNPITVSEIATQTGTHYIEVMYWVDGIDYQLEIDISGP